MKKHRILALLMAMTMSLSLAACDSDVDDEDEPQRVESIEESKEESTVEESTDSLTESTVESTKESEAVAVSASESTEESAGSLESEVVETTEAITESKVKEEQVSIEMLFQDILVCKILPGDQMFIENGNGEYFLCDIEDPLNTIKPIEFPGVKPIYPGGENMVYMDENGLYGVADLDGKIQVEAQFNGMTAKHFEDGKFFLYNHQEGVMDRLVLFDGKRGEDGSLRFLDMTSSAKRFTKVTSLNYYHQDAFILGEFMDEYGSLQYGAYCRDDATSQEIMLTDGSAIPLPADGYLVRQKVAGKKLIETEIAYDYDHQISNTLPFEGDAFYKPGVCSVGSDGWIDLNKMYVVSDDENGFNYENVNRRDYTENGHYFYNVFTEELVPGMIDSAGCRYRGEGSNERVISRDGIALETFPLNDADNYFIPYDIANQEVLNEEGFLDIEEFAEGVTKKYRAVRLLDGNPAFVDDRYQVVSDEYENVTYFEDGYAIVSKNGECYVIDENLECVSDKFTAEDVNLSKKGLVQIQRNGKYALCRIVPAED